MIWQVKYLAEASKDLQKLDGSQKILVLKAIKKVSQNPLPQQLGGYGKALGNHKDDLTGFYKIKLRNAGLRIVYKIIQTETEMIIVVIGARADDEVYELAASRIRKNSL